MGTSWEVITRTLQADDPPTPVASVLPEEGSTAWADNWMIHAEAEHPNCAYLWINHITSPEVQAEQSSTYGEAPANLAACETVAEHCEQYHAEDAEYYEQLHYWTTPTKECLDGRTDVECKDYAEWVDGVDRGEGLIEGRTSRRAVARALARRPRLRLGLTLSGPLLWFARRLRRRTRRAAHHVAVPQRDGGSDHRDGHRTRRSTTTAPSSTTTSTETWPLRTVGAAIAVTVIDLVIALPVAFFMAKVATTRARRQLVIAVTMPLWAGYLVKGYAWRGMLNPESGILKEVFGVSPGYGIWGTITVLAYLWLPYMVIPIYVGLDRLPTSLLEASTDLGGTAGRTFRVRGAAAARALDRGGVDLHVQPHPWRLLREPAPRRHDAVHRQHHLQQLQREPAAGGGLRHRADPHHGRLPARGPRRWRARGAVAMFLSRRARLALRIFTGLVLVVLYFPLLYVARLSFATSRGFAWPPSGWTLDHWNDARHAEAPRDALVNSLTDRAVGHPRRACARVARRRGPVPLPVLRAPCLQPLIVLPARAARHRHRHRAQRRLRPPRRRPLPGHPGHRSRHLLHRDRVQQRGRSHAPARAEHRRGLRRPRRRPAPDVPATCGSRS